MMACRKDRIKDPEFGPGDYPRIFDMSNVFVSPVMVIKPGESARYAGIQYSPAGKVNIAWKVNGETKSSDTTFTFTPVGNAGGNFTIDLEVELNGLKSNRTSTVLVNPDVYTLKPYNKVILAYVSSEGSTRDLKWDQLTHAVVYGGRVSADGSLNVTTGERNQRVDEAVARGHIAGKAVMLGISGRLSGLDGWSLYGSTDFGDAIATPAARTALVANIKAYVTAKKLDGVDLLMSDVSVDHTKYMAAMVPFVAELRAALPANSIITATVTAGWQYKEYPAALQSVNWVNLRAFEDGDHVGPGKPRRQGSTYDWMLFCAKRWTGTATDEKAWPANKIVLGVPAFGVRYTAIDANGNNLGWSSYEYVPFSTIMGYDPQAANKEKVDKDFGVFYNGKPLIKRKAEYIKANGFLGGYMWAADYDVADPANSLFTEFYNALK